MSIIRNILKKNSRSLKGGNFFLQIKDILGFETKYTVKDAVKDLKNVFEKKLLINTFDNEFYFNIKKFCSMSSLLHVRL